MSYIIGFIIIAILLAIVYKLIVPIIKFDPFKAVVEELESRNEKRRRHNCGCCSRYSTPFLTYYENDCMYDEIERLNEKMSRIMRYQRLSNRRFRNKRKKKS